MIKIFLFSFFISSMVQANSTDPLRPFQMGLPTPEYKVEKVEKYPKYNSKNHCAKPFGELMDAVDHLTQGQSASKAKGPDVEIPELYGKDGKIIETPKENSLDIEI